MLFKRQKTDWLLLAVLAIGLFTYASYQPRFRLRQDMPAEFMEALPAGSHQGQAEEHRIAQAYWNALVRDIQPRYGYGYSLPTDPPAEFTLAGAGGIPEDPATRIRYWHQAQHVWYLPSAWEKGYEWDFHWTSNMTQSVADWLHRQLQHVGGG